jgi:hypothetical protein
MVSEEAPRTLVAAEMLWSTRGGDKERFDESLVYQAKAAGRNRVLSRPDRRRQFRRADCNSGMTGPGGPRALATSPSSPH